VEEACQVAQRIQRELMLPIKLGEHDVFTSVSIGIVLSSIGSQTMEDLLVDATIACSGAKARGQGRYEVFDRSMGDRVESLLQLEKDLRRAIERNELFIYYQPIVSFRSGNIEGFEALARWSHPQRGLLLPQEFIPVAEETGLIISLDWWVLQEACRQMRYWQETFENLPDLTISANLSSKHFALPKIVAKIQQTLEITGLEPRYLSLEITEKALLENADVVQPKLSQLKDLGISLSLDDFGTGYSSLSYLHRFAVNSIKIDRTLIAKIPSDRPILEIVRTIVGLARSLNMRAIAEGVETEEQSAILKEIGCELGQGYFFYRPLSVEEVEKQICSGMGNR
jgi:EAL domain-containing protein (putative c-di-GMP-specific phosphodiesterase class I)